MGKEKKKSSEIAIRTRTLMHVTKALIPFMATDETRPHLMGLGIEVQDDMVYLAATNGRVIGVYEHAVWGNAPEGKWLITLPCIEVLSQIASMIDKLGRKNASTLLSIWRDIKDDADDVNFNDIDPPIFLDLKNGTARHALGTTHIEMSDQAFPPWRKVIPEWKKLKKTGGVSTKTVTAFDGHFMDEAIKAFKIMSRINGHPSSQLPLALFNEGPLDPITVRCGNVKEYTHVIMPMRTDAKDWTRPE